MPSENQQLRCTNGHLVEFDDGHTPETFHGNEDSVCRIVKGQRRCSPQCLSIFGDVLPEELTDRIYETSTIQKSWGTYVTMDEVLTRKNDNDCNTTIKEDPDQSLEEYRHNLGKEAVLNFIIHKASFIHQDFPKIHGVGIWALSSDVNDEVQYHIDYAELIRYEHNVIYPPLYAGTVQCAKVNVKSGAIMVGGDFCVHTGGLDHYAKHGYKGKKCHDLLIKDLESIPSHQDTLHDHGKQSWVKIPYRYNQGILHDGDFPHVSTKIKSLSPGIKRVILGLNLFGFDCGPMVMTAPEHSSAFNRKVKLYRALSKKMDLDAVKQNKALMKLLILAKREKVKHMTDEEKAELALV